MRSKLAVLLIAGVLAGVIVAAAVLPVAALAGIAVGRAPVAYDELPEALRDPATPQATLVYANDGKTLLATFFDENRRNVPLAAIAPVMQRAIVAAEDTRFFAHGPVDVRATIRAILVDLVGGTPAQGASTLTMQYVRNVLKDDPRLSPEERAEATADTAGRKLQEVRYAAAIEERLSKQDILDRYLNIAYFGAGAYGVYEASLRYFGVTPDRLSLAQAALLAGLVQSPDSDSPIGGDKAAALARRSYVLDAMVRAGDITSGQAAGAAAAPIRLAPRPIASGCADSNGWGFFCGYLRQWWDAQPAFGSTADARDEALRQGGYTIVTSLDPRVQAEALRESLSVYGYSSPRALPIAVVEPGTGRVLALAVNRHYSVAANPKGQRDYPNTVEQLVAGGDGITGYQSGSTFKLFTMLAALEAGYPLDTGFRAPARLVTNFPDGGPDSCGGYYCPVNDNPSWMDGYRTMWSGFGRSVNTYFVRLEQQIGPARAVDMAQRLGITFRASADARMAATSAGTWGSFTLGVVDTTPLDLAEAYATVAADGRYCKPLPVRSIVDSSGRRLSVADPRCAQAVSPDVAHAAADAARCPVGQQSAYDRCDGGTATVVSAILGDRPVLGKTGSSERNATETFVGATAQVAAAGIAADPADPSDAVGGGVSEAVDAAVADTIRAAVERLAPVEFPAPGTEIAFGAGPGPLP